MRLSVAALTACMALLGETVVSFQSQSSIGQSSRVACVTSKQARTSNDVLTGVQPGSYGFLNHRSPLSRLNMGMEEFLTGRDEKQRKADNDNYLAEQQKRVERINGLEPEIEDLDDDELVEKTQEFKERLKNGENMNESLLEEAFAVVREAAW